MENLAKIWGLCNEKNEKKYFPNKMFDQKIAVPVQLFGSVAYTKKLEATSNLRLSQILLPASKTWAVVGYALEDI